MGKTLLLVTLAAPGLAALVLPLLRGVAARAVAVVAAATTLLASTGLLIGRRDARAPLDPWHQIDVPWVDTLRLRFHIGIDGISWPLVVLTALLVLCCVLYLSSGGASEAANTRRLPLLLSLVFTLATAMIGVFVSLDVLLFFVFFELTLAPMYAVIAGWGGPQRRAAAVKFLLYTGLGSLLLAVGVLLLVSQSGTADLVELSAAGGAGLDYRAQLAIFVFLLLAFAIKAPLWPLHTWLPDAHTQAPTVGSVLLAGVMLKLGTYGLIRLVLPVLPDAARSAAWLIGAIAVAAIIAGALVCLAQTELKRLIAYSSVGHMGFVLLGVAAAASGSEVGLQAALLGNLAHGVITGLLFFVVGDIKDHFRTVELAQLAGLSQRAPLTAALLCFGAVASFGLPGLAGFWGEAFSVLAAWQHGGWWRVYAVVSAVGAAAVVAYFLRALHHVAQNPVTVVSRSRGVGIGRLLAVVPLVAVTLLLGVWPGGVLAMAADAVAAITGSLT